MTATRTDETIAANAPFSQLPPSRISDLRCACWSLLPLGMSAAFAQLRGHGGPVRALAISPDGQTAISGSFDSTAIRWSLARNAAEQVLRFHADAVNAVVLLGDGRAATAGADGRIAIWSSGKAEPDFVLEGHTAPIVALAASPDGATLASASWDQTVRLWPLAGGAPRVLEGHTQNVNGVAFAPDSRTLVSVSYDQSVSHLAAFGRGAADRRCDAEPAQRRGGRRRWRDRCRRRRRQALFSDGQRHDRRRVAAGPRPVISIAISPDGALVAAAGIGGSVAVIDRKTRTLARTLVGPGLPVWSVAFLPDSRTLLTGGADNIIRRWNAVTGDPIDPLLLEAAGDPLAAFAGDRGAGSLPRLRRMPHAQRRTNQPCRPDACGHFRPADRNACRVIIFPRRSSASISSGRRRRLQNCSRSGPRPTRRAPRCPSSASALNRIVPRWCNFSNARPADSRRNRWELKVPFKPEHPPSRKHRREM